MGLLPFGFASLIDPAVHVSFGRPLLSLGWLVEYAGCFDAISGHRSLLVIGVEILFLSIDATSRNNADA